MGDIFRGRAIMGKTRKDKKYKTNCSKNRYSNNQEIGLEFSL